MGLNGDCDRMNIFRIAVNKDKAHMRVIDGKISRAQTSEELFATKMVNNQARY